MNRSCYKYSNTFRIVFVKDREKEIYIGEKKTIFVHDHAININTKFVCHSRVTKYDYRK